MCHFSPTYISSLFSILSCYYLHLNHTAISMDSSFSWPENLSSDRRQVIEELVKGRESALRLQNLIRNSTENSRSEVLIEDLVVNILNSFTTPLSLLKNGDPDEVSQVLAHPQLSSGDAAYRKYEDAGESSKSSTTKDRRGCYKRRKCAETRTHHSSELIDDGHAWRKYGQKVILNAKFPRNYFRCTHKHNQGCQATKQVQQIEDDPPVYRTTYYGNHTCKNLLNASQLIMDQSPMISFGSSHITDKVSNAFLSTFQSIKQEWTDDHHHHYPLPSDMTYNQSSSSDYLLSSDQLAAFESTVLSSDRGDVISGVNSSSCTANTAHSLDIGAGISVESVDFDDVLELEF